MKRHYLILFLFFVINIQNIDAQIISTVTGSGIVGSAGNDGPAVFAQIGTSRGVALDAAGNIYMCDDSYSVIHKITAYTGVISIIAGINVSGYNGTDIPAVDAMLNFPYGIATDAAGNIYIADLDNHMVRKIDGSGMIRRFAGGGPGLSGGDGGPATNASFLPYAVAIDATGNLYIADGVNNRIRKVNTAGIISTVAGNGMAGYSGDGIAATASKLNNPQGVAADNAGNIYIAEVDGNRIRKVDAAGIISTIAGDGTAFSTGDGGPAAAARVKQPWSVALDGTGNIYIGHYGDSRVRVINTDGIIRSFAGNGIMGYAGDAGRAIYANVDDPGGMAFRGPGNIYIADYLNAVIRLVHDDSCFFQGGHVQHLAACAATAINPLLPVHDLDVGQRLWWSVISSPLHGTVTMSYNDTIFLSPTVPAGMSYTPAAGYTGTDTFKVRVTDNMFSDTTMICVSIYLPAPGVITGPDTVCVGHVIELGCAVPGGAWSTSNGNATVLTTGEVNGVAPGTVTITYIVDNACATSSVITKQVYVKGPLCVSLSAETIAGSDKPISIYPNPTNGTFVINTYADAAIVITDRLGKRVKEVMATANKPLTIDLNVPSGIYFLSARTAVGIWNEKLVIER